MFISNVFLKSAAVVSRFTLCKYLAITIVSEDYNTGYRTTIRSLTTPKIEQSLLSKKSTDLN